MHILRAPHRRNCSRLKYKIICWFQIVFSIAHFKVITPYTICLIFGISFYSWLLYSFILIFMSLRAITIGKKNRKAINQCTKQIKKNKWIIFKATTIYKSNSYMGSNSSIHNLIVQQKLSHIYGAPILFSPTFSLIFNP